MNSRVEKHRQRQKLRQNKIAMLLQYLDTPKFISSNKKFTAFAFK